MIDDHIYVNNHKIDKKGMIKVLILNFFNQQTLQWMLANIVYYNICVIYQKNNDKTVESHIVTSSNLLSIAVNGAHVKMADLRRWANLLYKNTDISGIFLECYLTTKDRCLYTQTWKENNLSTRGVLKG